MVRAGAHTGAAGWLRKRGSTRQELISQIYIELCTVLCAGTGRGTRPLSAWAWKFTGQGRPAKGKLTETTAKMVVSADERPVGSDSQSFIYMSWTTIKCQNIDRKTNPPKISPHVYHGRCWFFLLPVESWKSIEANMPVLTEVYQVMNTKKDFQKKRSFLGLKCFQISSFDILRYIHRFPTYPQISI